VNPGTGAASQRRARPWPKLCALPPAASESSARCTERWLAPSASASAELDQASPSESSYGAPAAWQALATTIDTGDDVTDPSDDLNVSSTASVCASCHDGRPARTHMLLHGASFMALDENID